MEGIAQYYLRTYRDQLMRIERLDRTVGSNRHENRGVNFTVSCGDSSTSGAAIGCQ